MKRLHRSLLVLLAGCCAAGAWSCAAGAPASLDDSVDDSASGTGGDTSGTAGAGTAGAGTAGAGTAGAGTAGAGTAGAAGAAGTSGLILGSGGPHPFPSNKKPMYCSLTTAGGAAAAAQSAYASWKSQYVTSSGAGGQLRVQDPQTASRTVSEGIGYGMLAAVYMADRATFDGLWKYAQAHFDAHGLMNWEINSAGTATSGGMGSATDADEDMIFALIQASDQWNDTTYVDAAKKMLTALFGTVIAADGMLKPGDGWGGTTNTFPDYFSPAYFRVFAAVSGNKNWATVVIDRNYAILQNVTGNYGLVPDEVNGSTYAAINPNYGYDACRTPWRIGMDYCFNGEPRAKAYLDKIAAFFNSQGGAAGIGDGYSTTGQKITPYSNMAFIGPAGVSGMAGTQGLLDAAFSYGAGNGGTNSYFAQSLRVVTMLMMSGNFVDFTKP